MPEQAAIDISQALAWATAELAKAAATDARNSKAGNSEAVDSEASDARIDLSVDLHIDLHLDTRLDAQLLLCHVLDCERSTLYAYPERLLSEAQREAFSRAIERRVAAEPLAYITGSKAFWSLDLAVDSRVLTPRADTESIVEAVLELPLPAECRAIDLGTGSGAIALALASSKPAWTVFASDRQLDALTVAAYNSHQLLAAAPESAPLAMFCADWLNACADQQFDLIVSNPPYIAHDDPELDASTQLEPATALFSADEGLADIMLIIEQARRCLRSGGWLVLEHGHRQQARVCELLQGFTELRCIDDLAGRPRGVAARYQS